MGAAKKLPLWTAPAASAVAVTSPGSVRVSLTDRDEVPFAVYDPFAEP